MGVPTTKRAADSGAERSLSAEDSAVFGVVTVTASGRVLRANAAFLQLLGYSSLDGLRGKTFPRGLLKRSSGWRAWAEVAEGAPARDVDVELVAATGQSVSLRGRIEPAPSTATREPAVRAVLVDDSSAQHLRELAVRTARTEGVLGLAAGISHDFNNLLTVLVGNLYLVSERLRDQPVLYEKVRKARDAAKRGAVLARQLTDLSRGTDAEAETTVLDVGKVVDSLMPLLNAALGSRIALKAEVAADSPAVLANRSQLESVITNLVINARDALVGRPQGNVVVSLRRLELGKDPAWPDLKAGIYAELAIRDDGAGIPREIQPHVFEPFFSTKQPGQGSGLGLPMVQWFAQRAGGAVSLRSRAGEGTVIRVLLPAHHAESAELGETAARTMPLSSLPSGSETIFVLSENRDFRSTVEQVLGALGYRVFSGGSADLAVSTRRAETAVLIVDAQALTASGVPQIDRFVERPDARMGAVLVGDSNVAWHTRAVLVPKPFTLDELATAVRAAIEGG